MPQGVAALHLATQHLARFGRRPLGLSPNASAWIIIFDATPSVLLAEPIIDVKMNKLMFHLRVRYVWVAPASALTPRHSTRSGKSNAIDCSCGYIICPIWRWTGLTDIDRAAASFYRPALLRGQSGHKRS